MVDENPAEILSHIQECVSKNDLSSAEIILDNHPALEERFPAIRKHILNKKESVLKSRVLTDSVAALNEIDDFLNQDGFKSSTSVESGSSDGFSGVNSGNFSGINSDFPPSIILPESLGNSINSFMSSGRTLKKFLIEKSEILAGGGHDLYTEKEKDTSDISIFDSLIYDSNIIINRVNHINNFIISCPEGFIENRQSLNYIEEFKSMLEDYAGLLKQQGVFLSSSIQHLEGSSFHKQFSELKAELGKKEKQILEKDRTIEELQCSVRDHEATVRQKEREMESLREKASIYGMVKEKNEQSLTYDENIVMGTVLKNFSGDSPPGRILLGTRKGPLMLSLWDDWFNFRNFLKPGVTVKVIRGNYTVYNDREILNAGKNALLVIEPESLVNVTDLASVSSCEYCYYCNSLFGKTEFNESMLRGTIVNSYFDGVVTGNLMGMWGIKQKFCLDLALLGLDESWLESEIRPHMEKIGRWKKENQDLVNSVEVSFMSSNLGITGRIDALAKDMVLELKSSAPPKTSIYNNIRYQVIGYLALLEVSGMKRDHGRVLFSGGSDENLVEFDLQERAFDNYNLIRFRNKALLISQGRYTPCPNEKCRLCELNDNILRAGQFSSEDTSVKYVRRLLRGLNAEARENEKQQSYVFTTPLHERVADGKALFPVKYLGLSEGLMVFETPGPGEFREGDQVIISEAGPGLGPVQSSSVKKIDGNKIYLRGKLSIKNPLVIDLFSNDFLTAEFKGELFNFLSDRQKAGYFTGETPAGFCNEQSEHNGHFYKKIYPLNSRQNEAVKTAISANNYAIIQGPAGTGKTKTIAELVKALKPDSNKRILLTAFTNRAVNNMVEALIASGYHDVLRIGSDDGLSDIVSQFSLEGTVNIDILRKKILTTPVIATTTSYISKSRFRGLKFHVAIIDEATQMTEPHSIAAINHAKKVIFVGDHKQLPPLVQSLDAITYSSLNVSMFQRLIENSGSHSVMLDTQYRMNDRILSLSNTLFYDGQLSSAPANKNHNLEGLGINIPDGMTADPLEFIDISGKMRRHVNEDEANTVVWAVNSLIFAGLSPVKIGVIAPFKAQVRKIRTLLSNPHVDVDTVDRFQGSDREAVILSLSYDKTPFRMFTPERLNVSITRAKRKLIIVGNSKVMKKDPYFRTILGIINNDDEEKNAGLMMISELCGGTVSKDLPSKAHFESHSEKSLSSYSTSSSSSSFSSSSLSSPSTSTSSSLMSEKSSEMPGKLVCQNGCNTVIADLVVYGRGAVELKCESCGEAVEIKGGFIAFDSNSLVNDIYYIIKDSDAFSGCSYGLPRLVCCEINRWKGMAGRSTIFHSANNSVIRLRSDHQNGNIKLFDFGRGPEDVNDFRNNDFCIMEDVGKNGGILLTKDVGIDLMATGGNLPVIRYDINKVKLRRDRYVIMRPGKKPLYEGSNTTVKILEESKREPGTGIAKIGAHTIFVKGGAAGEKCVIIIEEIKKNNAWAVKTC